MSNEMPAFRVMFENPKYNYVTSMAAGITLDDARQYFLGMWNKAYFDADGQEQENWQRCINVEQL